MWGAVLDLGSRSVLAVPGLINHSHVRTPRQMQLEYPGLAKFVPGQLSGLTVC